MIRFIGASWLNALKLEVFCDKWCSWLKHILYNGTISVRVNNMNGPYFQNYKGVRQEDPISPLLFNFVADSLTRMVLKAQSNGLIIGLIDHMIPGGITIMQYADDTVLCLKNDVLKERNAKLLLYLFEQLSGLKINLEKSEIILIGGDNSLVVEFAETFNCQIGCFPIKYLGVPISSGDYMWWIGKSWKKTLMCGRVTLCRLMGDLS
jgi:hypothetical protein